jgi:4a-hydroxytetrahydrobiopterin dehydratase
MTTCDLTDKKCVPCEGGVPPLTPVEIKKLLSNLNNWTLSTNDKEITKKYSFKNFYHVMSFVNALAWVANQEGHHPDLQVGYNYCNISFTTHAINGLSENDFICAAKIDLLKE